MAKVIDVHVHVGESSSLKISGQADAVLELMDCNGVDQAIIFGMPGFEDVEGVKTTREINDMVYSTRAANPERFVRMLGIAEPRQGKAILDEVDRVLGDLKMSGLMFHNDFSGVTLDAPIMFDIVERASHYPDVVIMAHTAQHSILEAPYQLGKLAKRFPQVRFLDAHPMMSIPQIGATIELAKECPNIYFDTCISQGKYFMIETFVKEIGAHRLMFGSDNPYYYYDKCCFDKELIEQADISKDDKELILYKNAEEFYRL